MNGFTGYSDETFEFFMAIAFNNNRSFFQDNRDWYLRSVREPSVALVNALAPVIEEIDPDLERRPHRVISHINRDVRYSKDKSPYRDYIWLGFKRVGEKSNDTTLGFYFDMSAEGSSFGLGTYKENKTMMSNLRRELDVNPGIMASKLVSFDQSFTLFTEMRKRIAVPENLPSEFETWYRAKGFYLQKRIEDFDALRSQELVEILKDGFRKLTPLYRYLRGLENESEEFQ